MWGGVVICGLVQLFDHRRSGRNLRDADQEVFRNSRRRCRQKIIVAPCTQSTRTAAKLGGTGPPTRERIQYACCQSSSPAHFPPCQASPLPQARPESVNADVRHVSSRPGQQEFTQTVDTADVYPCTKSRFQHRRSSREIETVRELFVTFEGYTPHIPVVEVFSSTRNQAPGISGSHRQGNKLADVDNGE